MASFIGTPIMNITQTTANVFDFRVEYTMKYSDTELTFPEGFADSLALNESDAGEIFGGGDDHLININVQTFRPTSTFETRVFTFSATADRLGTESGGEEIYAEVHHRRNIDGIASQTRRTAIFPLAV
ncbi:hypothetical protein [Streptomyces sp. ISL-94]|uniref:hypothetical protein n=1 Tax=Streptomyces sp. ISL-94 TaxID=2819190 RepID=UPI001BEAB8A3|nr:hypothetical protein [Streptomyces sp. ISL-94]MBT2481971.1 hypothetical protein [Streptomyces sp. ISL-94]